jgi:histone H3/H4
MNNITKPALYRLIKDQEQYNIKNQVSSLLYEELRFFLKDYVEKIIRQVIVVMEYMRTKTMLESHLYHILKHIPASNEILKQCMNGNKEHCFYIPKASFKKFVQYVVEEYKDNVRYSKDALNLLQIATEDHLKKYVKMAVLNAYHAKRMSVFPKDLQMAKRMDHESLYVDRVYTSHMKNIVNYDIQSMFSDISKVFRRNKKLEEDAAGQINTVVNRLGHIIMAKANDLLILKNASKIDALTIQTSVRLTMKGELTKHAVSAGTKAVTKYLSGSSRSTGLTFSMSDTRKLMDNYTNRMISKEAVVYLTAVLEYMTLELCEIAGQNPQELITGTLVKKAVAEDEEISLLLYTLNINFV